MLQRFQYDDEATVRGVLNDLVESGIVFRAGRGDRTTYRAAGPEDLSLHDEGESTAGVVNLVWLAVHRGGPASVESIEGVVPFDRTRLQAALDQLILDGRVTRSELDGSVRYAAEQCVIPLGEPGGWEAALFDHYQAMVATICTKLRLGQDRPLAADAVGGSTYGFTIWPGHPHHAEVLGFLGKMRAEASALRTKVREHNASHRPPDREGVGVIAYVGQTVIEPESEETQA